MHMSGKTVREIALEEKVLSVEKLNELLDAKSMTKPNFKLFLMVNSTPLTKVFLNTFLFLFIFLSIVIFMIVLSRIYLL